MDENFCRTYPMIEFIDAGVDITKWSDNDWHYEPAPDVMYIRPNSALQTYLYLIGLKPSFLASNVFSKNQHTLP